MKTKTLVAAAVIVSTSTMSFADDVSNAGSADDAVFLPVEKAATPLLLSTIIVGATIGLTGSGGT